MALPSWASADTQEALAGSWEAGPRVTEVAVESWDKSCAEAPQSNRAPGGIVDVQQHDDTLTIQGGGLTIRTDECWSTNRDLRRIGTSYHQGLWITRCSTAPTEPREEQSTFTIRALGPDRLLSQGVTHLSWKLGQSTCKATVTTTQSMLRRTQASATTAQSRSSTGGALDEASKTAAAGSRCTPGIAARVSLRPREAEISLGKKVCFQARVEDATGCPLNDAKPTWSMKQAPAVRGTLIGNCFQAGESSAESEGRFEVVADLGQLRGKASVRVIAHNLRELTARRVEGAPTPTATASGAEGAEPPPTRFRARALGQPERKQERLLMAIAALLALIAALLALYRRSKPRALTAVQHPTLRCPSCGALYSDDTAFCGTDGTALLPMRRS